MTEILLSQTQTSPFVQPAYLRRCENIFKALRGDLPWEHIQDVLDLGCGTGVVGQTFERLGKRVMFLDGRAENIEHLVAQGCQAIVHDAQLPLLFSDEMHIRADLVLCLGLLYHSENPQEILNNCAEMAPIIAVETLCMDRRGRYFLSFEEATSRADQSLDGGCCRFSPRWLERAMERAGYTDMFDVSPHVATVPPDSYHQGFLYDWEMRDSGDSYRDGYGLRKLWVASK